MKRAARLPIAALVLLAATAMLLQIGSVPHLHDDDEAGIYNQEHDLTLLAGLASHGLPTEPVPNLTIDAISAAVPPFLPECPTIRLPHSGESRAPPAA